MLGSVMAGVAAAGVATWAGFQSMWPTSQVYGQTFTGLAPGSPLMALTYDDGPNDPWTGRLLEVLEKHSVKATFFLIGRFVEQRPEIAREIVSAGHAIGIHTWDHPNLIFCSAGEVQRQVDRTRQVLIEATGVETRLFRPPFGGRRPGSMRTLRKLGLEVIMWNVTSHDWKPITSEQVIGYVQRQARGGDVILMHDGGHAGLGADREHTVVATDRLVPFYASQGRRFVTIPEMMASRAAQRPGILSS